MTGQPRRLATVTSMTECVIMRLDKATIVRVIHDEPKFSEMFMTFLLARNARVEEDLDDQLFNSSEKRLARLLLLMANFGKDTRPELVIAKISQETLAEMIGTTRVACECIHEQIPETWIHRIQWTVGNPPFLIEHGFA